MHTLQALAASVGNGRWRNPDAIPPSQPEEKIAHKAPPGESGGQPAPASPHLSLLRLFQFENIHATAHRQRALARGDKVASQDIRIRTGVLRGGHLIGVAGATETEVAVGGDEEGAPTAETELIRELAYLADTRGVIASGGSGLFGMARKIMPRIRHVGSFVSGYQVLRNRKKIIQKADQGTVQDLLRSISPESLKKMLDAFEPLDRGLADLSSLLDRFEASGSALTGMKTEGGQPVVSVSIDSPEAVPASYRITVERLAGAHSAVSSLYIPDETPMSELYDENGDQILTEAEYDFSLNGVTVTVQQNDTLRDIATIINRGEDFDQDGIIDSGEDSDGNGYLDGGTGAHGIVATVEDGHLRLSAETASPDPMQVFDTDGLLTAIGLIEEDESGRQQFVNETALPASAVFYIDDTRYDKPANTVSDVIEGVTVSLLETGDSTVSILSDPDTAISELQQLAGEYNKVIAEFNNVLSPALQGLLKDEPHVNTVYINLRHAAEARVSGQPEQLEFPAQAGLGSEPGNQLSFNEQQLANAVFSLQKESPLMKVTTPGTVYRSLDELGIRTEEDNTLTVDEETVREAIASHHEAMRTLFRGPEGILPRLLEVTHSTIDPMSGTMAFGKRILGMMQGLDVSEHFRNALLNYQTGLQRGRLAQLAMVNLIA